VNTTKSRACDRTARLRDHVYSSFWNSIHQNLSPMCANHSMQRMGASRSAQFQSLHQRRLAPAADAERWAGG
jgi:hypothetical protein